jgi:4-amino-4-deoxy-L-arabinose transferase-like glycosyltransferase
MNIAWFRKHSVGVALVAIIVIAVFFRFWHLGSAPPGLHPDEAANGLDVISIIEHHNYQVLYNTNGPREALFFYLQAIFVLLFGYTQAALRIAPALCGVASVFAAYLLTKQIWGKLAALIASFLVATSAWEITITRDGFRAAMTPLMTTMSLYYYVRGFKSKKNSDFAWAGVWLGLGMYTYLAFRLFPLVFVVMIIWAAIFRRDLFAKWWKQVLLSWVVALIVFIPMGIYAAEHPDVFFARSAGVSIFTPGNNHGSAIGALASNVEKVVLQFNVKGDSNFRQNLGGQPQLGPVEGVLFLAGLAFFFWRIKRPEYLLVLAAFGVMVLPEVFSTEAPHGLRSIGAIPYIQMMGGVFAAWGIRRYFATFPRNLAAKYAMYAIVTVATLGTIWFSYQRYFVVWAHSEQTYEAYSRDAVDIATSADAAAKMHTGQRFYILIDGYSDKTVEYLTHRRATYTRVDASKVFDLQLAPGKDLIYTNTATDNLASFKTLQLRYPGGKVTGNYAPFYNKDDFYEYAVTVP